MDAVGILTIGLWVLLAVQGVAILGVARTLSALRARTPRELRGLPPGSMLPSFAATDIHRDLEINSSSIRGKRSLILFLSTDCPNCLQIAAEMKKRPSLPANFFVYCHGSKAACLKTFETIGSRIPVIWGDNEAFLDELLLPGMPAIVLLDERLAVVETQFPTTFSEVAQSYHKLYSGSDVPELVAVSHAFGNLD